MFSSLPIKYYVNIRKLKASKLKLSSQNPRLIRSEQFEYY